ncbi:helix-turn-helix domain-containing protein [Paenibacillus pini]|uniref:Helix-turn-helix conjugative transposon-like domain-containing protein n=1 Tax=Paenibacillus pini JCM 16418 TaxID=1236976 RepID=W7YJJ2_9BACL|nr:helix-turn-helix domain-containing protein [Paenibacillus pini]GAF07843.1 hypothetical protein JCM16418_1874 [Paenibacillus pini JCM 16418]
MKNELYDLVLRAQNGDNDALQEILTIISPKIRFARTQIKPDRQDDLEQNILETLIRKIMTYDLNQTPDFSAFCRQKSKNVK